MCTCNWKSILSRRVLTQSISTRLLVLAFSHKPHHKTTLTLVSLKIPTQTSPKKLHQPTLILTSLKKLHQQALRLMSLKKLHQRALRLMSLKTLHHPALVVRSKTLHHPALVVRSKTLHHPALVVRSKKLHQANLKVPHTKTLKLLKTSGAVKQLMQMVKGQTKERLPTLHKIKWASTVYMCTVKYVYLYFLIIIFWCEWHYPYL